MKNASTFFLIAGPCVIESEQLTFSIAEQLVGLTARLGIPLVFKASFDKANRTSGKAYRGLGIKEGLGILAEVKKRFGCRVLTDIHDPAQVGPASKSVDVLQIPAFLCRQTDLLLAAAGSGCTVNVKKGQFLAPDDVDNIATKLRSGGCSDYYITERGTTFGYHNLVVDMRGLAAMRTAGHRVVFDATHSVQRPGGNGASTGGRSHLCAGPRPRRYRRRHRRSLHRNAPRPRQLSLGRREHDSTCADGAPAANVKGDP